MEYFGFGDESGTSVHDECYSIGILCIPKFKLPHFNSKLVLLKKKYGIVGELKWQKIKNSSGQVKICLDIMKLLMKPSYVFHVIVVTKSEYRNWTKDEVSAFYQTYTFLLKNVASRINGELSVIIDQRTDKYKKHDETIGVVANHMLAKSGVSRKINDVKMQNSKAFLGLQAVDILTGIVNTGYLEYLNSTKSISKAKKEVLKKGAGLLGWDKIWYDTYPNKDFNIWHFPIETRGKPATKSILKMFVL